MYILYGFKNNEWNKIAETNFREYISSNYFGYGTLEKLYKAHINNYKK